MWYPPLPDVSIDKVAKPQQRAWIGHIGILNSVDTVRYSSTFILLTSGGELFARNWSKDCLAPGAQEATADLPILTEKDPMVENLQETSQEVCFLLLTARHGLGRCP